MKMLHDALNTLTDAGAIETADAHCDIPCKIYDPSTAQIAALSVVRLLDIMKEAFDKDGGASMETSNTIARCVMRKEEEAEKVKHEIRIIWGDYIKGPILEKFPDAPGVAHQIMLKASSCKQGVSRADGEALVDLVNQFATIFWESKGMSVETKTAPYPPALDVVRPVL